MTWWCIFTLLLTGIFTNISLIVCALGCPPFELFPPYFFRAILRAENAAFALQFYAMFVLARNFSSKQQKKLPDIFKYFTIGSVALFLFRVFYCFFSADALPSPFYEIWATVILIEGFIAIAIMYRNYKEEPLSLLRYHIGTLGFYYMLPYCGFKIFENPLFSPTLFFPSTKLQINFPATSLTSMWLTIIIYYCARKLVGVRFLNMEKHVEPRHYEKFNFIDDFKVVLNKLGSIFTLDEVQPITKYFFEQAFNIPSEHVSLVVRDGKTPLKDLTDGDDSENKQETLIEKVFSANADYSRLVSVIGKDKIIIRDEVEFSHFYNTSAEHEIELREAINFMKELKADIFLPIYYDSKFIGCVIIDHGARPLKFYTDIERDEMVIYATYLGSIIYLLANMNLSTILQRERSLQFELYKKGKILSILRKSIYSFIMNRRRGVGILTYKNKKFSYANQMAKDMLNVDLNNDKGMEVTHRLTTLANDVATFFNPKRTLINENQEDALSVHIAPNVEKTTTILTVTHPTLADLVRDSITHLKDQSKWNFVLALRSTPEGKYVNNLLPADTPFFLNLKVNLFELATTRKALHLEMIGEEDALAFAHVAHKINNRKFFEEISIERTTNEFELSYKLFGMNPLFESSSKKSLLDILHKRGTLYLKNIHLLSLDLQRSLLSYIQSGKYSPLKSEEVRDADVLMVCSTDQNMYELVSRGLFLKDLYHELRKVNVTLPSLISLPEEETIALAEGLRSQMVMSKMYQNLLVFNESDRRKILESNCMSIYELKMKIQSIIFRKTKRQAIKEGAVIDPGSTISDLDLAAAARLGRHVLKDPKMLAMLLKKFKNSQSKVAQFLGVNRSTVNRRCFQYNLKTDD